MAYLNRPDRSGTVFADFELRKQIGRGYFGDVYKAIYLPNGKLFAFKLLDADANDDARRRFRGEFKVLSTINSPRLVQAHHYGELVDGSLFFTSDLLAGQNFEQHLETHRSILPDQALRWCLQICEAVQGLHESGILHRDLKPANMQLDDQGELTLLDLGSCKCMSIFYADSQRQYMTAPEDRYLTAPSKRRDLCTTGYRAPEATRDEPSPLLDVYSIGAILHRILLGGAPDKAIGDTREKIESIYIRTALECALAQEPKDRYQSVASLIRELNFALDMVQLELGIGPTPPEKQEPVETNEPEGSGARAVEEAMPMRGPRWVRQTVAAGCVFALGWFASGLSAKTVRAENSVEASMPSARLFQKSEAEQVPTRAFPSTALADPGSSSSSTPETQPQPGESAMNVSPAEAEVKAEAEPAKAPFEARARRHRNKPAAKAASKSVNAFEQDLQARMKICQLPPQSVGYTIQGGALEDLRFEHKPGSIQRSCVRDGLRGSYGQLNLNGQLAYRRQGS